MSVQPTENEFDEDEFDEAEFERERAKEREREEFDAALDAILVVDAPRTVKRILGVLPVGDRCVVARELHYELEMYVDRDALIRSRDKKEAREASRRRDFLFSEYPRFVFDELCGFSGGMIRMGTTRVVAQSILDVLTEIIKDPAYTPGE